MGAWINEVFRNSVVFQMEQTPATLHGLGGVWTLEAKKGRLVDKS